MVKVEITIWRGMITGVEAEGGPCTVTVIDEDVGTEEEYHFRGKITHKEKKDGRTEG